MALGALQNEADLRRWLEARLPDLKVAARQAGGGAGGTGAVSSVAGKTGAVTLVEGDIASLAADLAAKEDVANKDIDGTMAANSDLRYPSQKAVRTYVTAHAGGSDFVNAVRDYGADNTGATDTSTALQNAATAATGRKLYMPKGTYLGRFTLPAGTELIGDGEDSTILKTAPTGSLGAALVLGGDGCVVRGIQIDGNAAASPSGNNFGILVSSRRDFVIEDFFIHDTLGGTVPQGTGIYGIDPQAFSINRGRIVTPGNKGIWLECNTSSGAVYYDISISRVVVDRSSSGTNRNGLDVIQSGTDIFQRMRVTDCTFLQAATDTTEIAAEFDHVVDLVVRGCSTRYGTMGISLNICQRSRVVECDVLTPGLTGIETASGSDLLVEGCYVNGGNTTNNGIHVDGTSADRVRIVGNSVVDCTNAGVRAANHASVIINGNNIGARNSSQCIQVQGSTTVDSKTLITGNDLNALFTGATRATYGIQMQTGTQDVEITGNVIHDYATAGIRLSSGSFLGHYGPNVISSGVGTGLNFSGATTTFFVSVP